MAKKNLSRSELRKQNRRRSIKKLERDIVLEEALLQGLENLAISDNEIDPNQPFVGDYYCIDEVFGTGFFQIVDISKGLALMKNVVAGYKISMSVRDLFTKRKATQDEAAEFKAHYFNDFVIPVLDNRFRKSPKKTKGER